MSVGSLHAGTLARELTCLLAAQGFEMHEPSIAINILGRHDDPVASTVAMSVAFAGKRDERQAIIDLTQPLDGVSVALQPIAAQFAEALLPLERRPSWRNMT